MSEHLRLEVLAAAWAGKPLPPGAPVPGCRCVDCTGIPTARRRRSTPPRGDLRPALDIDAARNVPIVGVARSVGIHPTRELRNGDAWARCPFHDDTHPSLHLNTKKNAAFCNPCGRSWDPIALMMEMTSMSFVDAVRELTGRRVA